MLERAVTSARLRALDLRDRLGGRADRLVPPRRMDFVGHSDFVDTGDEYLRHFTELAGLRPDERVLDIGCGIGRMARPLAGHLSREGSYDGFDINREGIAWCRDRYRHLPNFRFVVADLHNRRYNPSGSQPAVTFRFPYEDDSFDLAICTSVLTHLVTEEAEHYLAETARVLAPGGRLLATFFLLDDASRSALDDGRAVLAFGPAQGPMAVVDRKVPEEAVAYDAEWVHGALAGSGLVQRAVVPGAWRAGSESTDDSFQDLVVADLA